MKKIVLILTIASVFSCGEKSRKDELPKVVDVDLLKQTDFVGTLENEIPINKNIIYTPTLLFAWNEIKTKFPDITLLEAENRGDLDKLHASTSFMNSLKKGEYKTDIKASANAIVAKANFDMDLKFVPELQIPKKQFYFKFKRVEAFGMDEFDAELVKNIEILYFKDNENFIFKLKPKQKDHELIFVKGLINPKTLADVLSQANSYVDSGKIELKEQKNVWKFNLGKKETFLIPKLKFNIEKNYKSILGKKVEIDRIPYKFTTVYQRTGFILDQKGAYIESEAEIVLFTTSAQPDEIEIAQHLHLDDTFYIIIKHKDQKNPYFVMKVDNRELMIK